MPEFDNPGHTRSVGLYKPMNDLLTCFDSVWPYDVHGVYRIKGGPPSGALDPSMDRTYEFVRGVLKDITGYFKDELIHLGGDEVSEKCWNERPSIREFMKKNGITDFNGLMSYYLKREREILKDLTPTKKAVYWTSENDFQIKYPAGDVLQFWGESKNMARMKDLFPNNKFILSPHDFTYLDCGYENPYGGNAWCGDFKTWAKIYNFEPTNYGIPEAKILGGEVCAWAEVTNDDNIENKLWPRSVSLAAVLWEQKRTGIADLPKLVMALDDFSKKLNKMGIRTSPITGQYCEINAKECFQKWD